MMIITFGILNIAMISQYNAFKSRLVYYRDQFYTNTEQDSLIIGNDAWDKLFHPYFSRTHGERYYLRYDRLSETEIIEELLPFLDIWMDERPVYFIDDPYEAYADKNIHDFVLLVLIENYNLDSVFATDQPYTVELFKVSR